MSEPRLTIPELVESFQKKTDISTEKAKDFINRYFSIIADELKNNDSVSIYKFGTFKKKWKAQSTRRNPRNGNAVEVAAHFKITFSPNNAVADIINKPYAKLKTVVLKGPEIQPKAKAGQKAEDDALAETALQAPFENLPQSENFAPPEFEAAQPPENNAQSVPENFDEIETSLNKIELPKTPAAQPQPTPQTQTATKSQPAQNQAEATQTVRLVVSAEQPQILAGASSVPGQPQVREQIIERQVIKEQIIEQRVTRQTKEDDVFEHDYEISDADRNAEYKIIARCWFVAGIAVVCTVIIIGLLISVAVGAYRDGAAARAQAASRLEQQIADAAQMRLIAPNTYAEIAQLEYGEPRLWPYIYSANRLRYSDPDYEIRRREIVLPPRPDRTLDSTIIEQAAIDAYRMYSNEYNSKPNSAIGKEKHLRAARVIADIEQLLPGFISRYELSFKSDDVQLARRYLGN